MTQPGTGITAQFGIATESTYGTAAAISDFLEFTSETLNLTKNTVVSAGLGGGGQVARSARRVVTSQGGEGAVSLELPTVGLGSLLYHATGTASSPYVLADLTGISATVEVGVPLFDGTLVSKKMSGCKVTQFQLGVETGGIATGSFTFNGKDFSMSGAPAAASYAAGSFFHFGQGTVSFGGSTAGYIKSFSVSVDNAMNVERYGLDGTGLKKEQLIAGYRAITGSVTAEFVSTSILAALLSDASASLSLAFAGAGSAALEIELPCVKFDGDVPQVGGPGPVEATYNFTAYYNDVDEPLTITYTEAV